MPLLLIICIVQRAKTSSSYQRLNKHSSFKITTIKTERKEKDSSALTPADLIKLFKEPTRFKPQIQYNHVNPQKLMSLVSQRSSDKLASFQPYSKGIRDWKYIQETCVERPFTNNPEIASMQRNTVSLNNSFSKNPKSIDKSPKSEVKRPVVHRRVYSTAFNRKEDKKPKCLLTLKNFQFKEIDDIFSKIHSEKPSATERESMTSRSPDKYQSKNFSIKEYNHNISHGLVEKNGSGEKGVPGIKVIDELETTSDDWSHKKRSASVPKIINVANLYTDSSKVINSKNTLNVSDINKIRMASRESIHMRGVLSSHSQRPFYEMGTSNINNIGEDRPFSQYSNFGKQSNKLYEQHVLKNLKTLMRNTKTEEREIPSQSMKYTKSYLSTHQISSIQDDRIQQDEEGFKAMNQKNC